VPSINCGGAHCGERLEYNSSASSSYVEDGTLKRTTYGPIMAYGRESVDTLILGDGHGEEVKVEGQRFQELMYYEDVYPDFVTTEFDAVLGLAWETLWLMEDWRSPSTLESVWKRLVEGGTLGRNVFDVVLPNGEREGRIGFGEEVEFEEGLVKHSLFPADTKNWQVEMEGIKLNGKMLGKGGYTAVLMTQGPVLILPAVIGDPITRNFNERWKSCAKTGTIPCEDVKNLPVLGIQIGGQQIEMRGHEYVEKIWFPECVGEEWQCVPLVASVPAYVPPKEFPKDMVVLGNAFLRRVRTVFDWDERSVSCEFFLPDSGMLLTIGCLVEIL